MELSYLHRENLRLQMERSHPGKGYGLLRRQGRGDVHAAMAESFFATLECELIDRRIFRTKPRRGWRCSRTSRVATTRAGAKAPWPIAHQLTSNGAVQARSTLSVSASNTTCPPSASAWHAPRRRWTYMDAPSFAKAFFRRWPIRRRLQTYIRPSGAMRFGPDGMRWLAPLQVLRARGSLSTPGSTSPGPTCLAINDRLPKQPCGRVFSLSCQQLSGMRSYAACGVYPGSYALPEDSNAQARRAFLLAIATAATL